MIYAKQISAVEGAELLKKCNSPKENGQEQLIMKKEETYSNEMQSQLPMSRMSDIAIIGMSGQFPKSDNVSEFWDHLVEGDNCVSEITRWDMSDIYDPTPHTPNKTYLKQAGLLDHIDEFDPLFFGLSPKQAELMEPRQRVILKEAYKALEDAGYCKETMDGKDCGVFIGCEGDTDYFKGIEQIDGYTMNSHHFLGHSNSVLAARISYFLNLKGPCATIDTACSSALSALHFACLSLLSGECDMALVGGITILTDPNNFVLLSAMNMLSKEGKCQAFSDSADGFVPGEAAGVIVLKPLEKAMKDLDHIYGVIKGTAMNQDGRTNGITAPSSKSQYELESRLYRKTGVNPESISYIEAHGTGTKLGDPIEFDALTKAFRDYTMKKQFCGIGSVKTNVGHAAAASGIVGIIKILLALKEEVIPKSLHMVKANSEISFSDSPFFFTEENMQWTRGKTVRRAAVSSFGHSGTNGHVIIEEAPEMVVRENLEGKTFPIPLSGKTKGALHRQIENLLDWLENRKKNETIGQIAYTLCTGRSHFKYRYLFWSESTDDLKRQLRQYLSTEKALSENEQLRQQQTLFIQGEKIEFQNFFHENKYPKISLPTYPFEKESYWITDDLRKNAKNEVEEKDDVMELLRQLSRNEINLDEADEKTEGFYGK